MTQDPATATTPAASPALATSDRRVAIAVAVGLAIALAVVVAVVLFGGGTSSVVARWAPADTLVYGELRLDAAGGQRDELEAFIGRLPGLAGVAGSDGPLGALLDDETGSWFGGQLGVAKGPGAIAASDRHATGVAIATVTDEAAARTWLASRLAAARDVTWQVKGGIAFVGDLESVSAAVATGGASPFASRPEVATARRELGSGQLAFTFADAVGLAGGLGGDGSAHPPMPPGIDLGERLPAWIAGGLRFDDASAIVTSVAPHREDLDLRNTTSEIPGRVPATTIALFDVHDAGALLASGLAGLGDIEQEVEVFGMPGMLGGLGRSLDWIDEAAVVVGDGEGKGGPAVALVATSDDPEASAKLLEQVELAARLSGGSVERTPHGEATIVTVTLGAIGSLLGGPGGAGGPGMSPGLIIGDDATVSWALANDLLIVSPEAGYVGAILDTRPETSLATLPTYDRLARRAGTSGVATGWLDIDRAPELIDNDRTEPGQLDPMPLPAALDAAVGTLTIGATTDRMTLVVGTDQDG